MNWALADAKNRFSEVVERAIVEGPQRVQRHGRDAVVVMAAKDYDRLQKPKKNFIKHLMSAPGLAELDLVRDRSPARRIDL